VVLPRCGHSPHLERTAECAVVLRAFLDADVAVDERGA
jgi:hypothetical protein